MKPEGTPVNHDTAFSSFSQYQKFRFSETDSKYEFTCHIIIPQSIAYPRTYQKMKISSTRMHSNYVLIPVKLEL